MPKILILNGPNLNMLGKREPEIYGHETLEDINSQCVALCEKLGFESQCMQSNHEGDLITAVQEAGSAGTLIVFNPGAYSHTSIGLRDAIVASNAQVIEVHISNIAAREHFRHHSKITAVSIGTIAGLGTKGYQLAIHAFKERITGA